MLHCESITHIGARPVNEDSCTVCQNGPLTLLCLADGLGGHGHGDAASQLAVRTAAALAGAGIPPQQLLGHMAQAVQQALHAQQQAQGCPGAMKTTLNLALVRQDMLYWGHVGDSRTYVFRAGKLLARTRDHSVPQALVAAGELREKNIRHHPDRSRLLRVLGGEEETPRWEDEPPLQLCPGDALLLCSDGFWENITEREMLHALKKVRGDAVQWLHAMDARVQRRGQGTHMDNNTAVTAVVAPE